MPNYHTIVFASGRVLQFRMRDATCNRFKVCLEFTQEEQEGLFGFDIDDCNGEEFATICRIMSELP